nr:MAG TPA: hypothetical protein [Inoviridae sp.]
MVLNNRSDMVILCKSPKFPFLGKCNIDLFPILEI